ncbi:hypothetical protein N752_01965 [Desulforamulus aquiferis]|nr:hypothetical protein N752_01965 [Desulforamulus aquiferis]
MQQLPISFYDRPTTLVAREILGKLLVHAHDEGMTVVELSKQRPTSRVIPPVMQPEE